MANEQNMNSQQNSNTECQLDEQVSKQAWDKTDDNSQEVEAQKRLHLHFGSGRLGLGLVLPALTAGPSRFALVQRPSKDWKALYEQGGDARVTFCVNGKPIIQDVRVSTEKTGFDKEARAQVTLTQDDDFYRELVQMATSFSTSLGPAIPKVMAPILEKLDDKPEGKRPVLYACENEHEPVQELAKQVGGKVRVVTCMVDRICTNKEVEGDRINCDAEPDFPGSIVVLQPVEEDQVPFGGEHISVPKDEHVSDYLFQRKFSIVNGGHSVLAFLTLREHNAEPKDPLEDFPLIKPLEASPDLKAEIDAWLKMRTVQLLDEVGVDTMKKAHNVQQEQQVFDELLSFMDHTSTRMSSLEDTTGRIFGPEIDERWGARLRPMWKYTQEHSWTGTDTPMGRFIKYADVDEEFARDHIRQLTTLSVKYVSQDLQTEANKTEMGIQSTISANQGGSKASMVTRAANWVKKLAPTS